MEKFITLEEMYNFDTSNMKNVFEDYKIKGEAIEDCSCMVYRNSNNINLWGNRVSLIADEDKNKYSIEDIRTWLQALSEDKNVCSECHAISNEKYESFFAGYYCPKCWTPKLAAERNYEYSHLD